MTVISPSRTIVEALRLDKRSDDEVRTRVGRALELDVGGFILFGGEADSVARLTEDIRSQAGRDLWVAADLERGAGQQFRGLSEVPPPAALARHPDPLAATRHAASVTAAEALSVGVNWVLSPVLDLDAERENPIVATRSFGADPATVSELGRCWIETCQGVGALACGKHFPGHGRTLADSHIELPVVAAPTSVLDLDLAPFRAIVDVSGSVMVAHVAYPAYGSNGPATVSHEIVSGLLRGELGFSGLVATDAMIMAGVGEDAAGAAVEALRAGCDIILYPGDLERTVRAVEHAAEVEDGFAERVAESVARSELALRLYSSQPADRVRAGSVGRALEFASEAIVGEVELVDWDALVPTEVVALTDDPAIGPPAGRDGPLGAILSDELTDSGWVTRRVEVDSGALGGTPSGTAQRIVVLAATPRGWKGHGGPSPAVVDRVRREIQTAARGMLVLLGHERWLMELGVPGICAWSTESIMERAAAVWIDGQVARRRAR